MSTQTSVSNVHRKSEGPGEGLGQSHIQQGTLPGVSAGQSLVLTQTDITVHKVVLSKPNIVIKSEEVLLEDGEVLEEGQTYMLRDRQGNSKMMIWKESQFHPVATDRLENSMH